MAQGGSLRFYCGVTNLLKHKARRETTSLFFYSLMTGTAEPAWY